MQHGKVGCNHILLLWGAEEMCAPEHIPSGLLKHPDLHQRDRCKKLFLARGRFALNCKTTFKYVFVVEKLSNQNEW